MVLLHLHIHVLWQFDDSFVLSFYLLSSCKGDFTYVDGCVSFAKHYAANGGCYCIRNSRYVLLSIPRLVFQYSYITVGKWGYYLPWAIWSGIGTSIGVGLISTLTPTTSTAKWVGYQILMGIGRGTGFQMVSPSLPLFPLSFK